MRRASLQCVRGLIVVMSVLCAQHSPSQSELPTFEGFLENHTVPTTATQVLQLAHSLAQMSVYRRDELFSEAIMQRLFGSSVQSRVTSGQGISIVSMHGFADLVEPKSAAELSARGMEKLAGIWFEARKSDTRGWSRMDVTFWGEMPGLQFSEVTMALGPGWTRDKRMELQRQAGHGHYPSPPPAVHAMGNSIITYEVPGAKAVLSFDRNGRLSSFDVFYKATE